MCVCRWCVSDLITGRRPSGVAAGNEKGERCMYDVYAAAMSDERRGGGGECERSVGKAGRW